jgi:hypothetical protein
MYNNTSTLHNVIDGLYQTPVDHVTSIGKNWKFFKLLACYGYESRWRVKYGNVMQIHSAIHPYVYMINLTSRLNTVATWKNDHFGWKFQFLKCYNFWMKRAIDGINVWCCRVMFVVYMHIYTRSTPCIFKLIWSINRKNDKFWIFNQKCPGLSGRTKFGQLCHNIEQR